MDEIIKSSIISIWETMKLGAMIIGFVIPTVLLFSKFIREIPFLMNTWINYKKRRARNSIYKENKKEAIKLDIENILNSVSNEIKKELPKEWFKDINFEWVKDSNDIEIADNEIILRIRPLENQDDNIIIATHSFLKSITFPKTSSVIPDKILEASVLKISDKVIKSQKPFLRERFTNTILEEAIQKERGILKYYGKFGHLDGRGFFSLFVLREIDELSNSIRTDERRESIGQEIDDILEHIIKFSDGIFREEYFLKNEDWTRKGFTGYSFLLVARDKNQKVDIYINKAKLKQKLGIERLYVIGKSNRIKFTKKVIKKISKLEGFKLMDKHRLPYDYRENRGGIGAVFKVSVPESKIDI